MVRTRSPADEVVVEVRGRLGNQLFSLAAGFLAARTTGRRLVVDSSQLNRAGLARSLEVLGFDWSFSPDISFEDRPRTGVDRFNFRGATRIQNALSRLTGGAVPATMRARSPGYDRRLARPARYRRLSGHFQAADHVAQACTLGFPRRLAPVKPGPWLVDLEQRSGEEDPLMVIVRLADYRRHHATLGLLAPGYFARGLDHVDGRNERRIWLFSDEPAAAAAYLPASVLDRVWVVPQPPELPREHVVLAASLGRTYVIANSTFAWWAAWMSGPDSIVVAPRPWFRSRDVPGIMPAAWEVEPASWQLVDTS